MRNCLDCNKEEIKGRGRCGSCYAKWYRRNNEPKVKSYNKMRYKRDRVKILEESNKWRKNNTDKVNKYQSKRKAGQRKYETIARETRRIFMDEKIECKECKTKDNLQFHHPEPLATDNFIVLCRSCHMALHSSIGRRITPLNGDKKNGMD